MPVPLSPMGPMGALLQYSERTVIMQVVVSYVRQAGTYIVLSGNFEAVQNSRK